MNARNTQTSGRKTKKITKDDIGKARHKLELFRSAKTGLNNTIRYNENWYRQRHMEYLRSGERLNADGFAGTPILNRERGETVEPVSAWLFTAIQNFHADYSDNAPRANCLPREPGDEEEAYKITKILPSLLDRNNFEETYSRAGWTKAIQGWSVYTVTWDPDADNGRGDISIGRAKLMNLYWDMDVDDLEKSSDVFYLHERDREQLEQEYPRLKNELVAKDGETESLADNRVGGLPTKVTVVDWYYKAKNKKGKTVLHLCQFAGDAILYASQNEPSLSERGLYDHGRYPFIVDVLYPMEDTLYGFGKVAVGENKQAYIDILSSAILKNALWAAQPRYFVKRGHGFNEKDFLNLKKKLIEVEATGDLREDIVRVEVANIDGNALSLQQSMIEEMRETTNMRDVATGSTTGGVTAASGIAALQEAAGKMSRDSNRTTFRAFKNLVVMIIELIRQFYNESHYFRIMNEQTGDSEYIEINNQGLRTERGDVLFDIEITTEKSSSYTRMAQNELMLSFYNAKFFDPNLADQSLACLQMMDFEGKEELIRMVGENNNRRQTLQAALEYMRTIAVSYDQIMAQAGYQSSVVNDVDMLTQQILGADAAGSGNARIPQEIGESAVTKKAREETASRASPV